MPVKMWRGWSSVQTRLTGVMAVAAIFAALMLVAFRTDATRRMDAYMVADAEEDGGLLDRSLELKGGSLTTFAGDYSNWGEMVQFVQTKDRTWASVNIDKGIGTYQANAAWVFDPAGAPVYAVRDSTLEARFEPLPPGLSVKDVFGDSHFCHFFIAGPDGPVEIRGATVAPSDDPERKTPVRGYFLVARLWNGQYLAELSRLTGKTVRIEPARDRTKPSTEIARQSGEITFTRPLPGPQGKSELMLTASYRPEWIPAARRSSSDLSTQVAALALLAVLGLTLVLWFWVTQPLDRISRSLQSGTTEALKPLERNRTEFGQLAQLVRQFFGQNAALVKEVAERKQAEQTLRESEERFRELFESMSSGVAVYETHDQGASFIFKNLNRGGERIDSLRREEVVGRSAQQVFPGIEKFGLLAVLRRVWQTGKAERHPVGHYEDDRIAGWRENYVYKLPSGEVVAVYDDVTERVETEVVLRENEARLREAQVLGRTGNWVFDLDSQKLEWSDGTYRLYERDKPLGPPTLEEEASYYSPDEALMLRVFARQAIEEGHALSYDLTANLPSGRTVVFSAMMRPVKDETGRVVKLFGTIQDITERKQAEAALRESEQRYRETIDALPEAVFESGPDGRLTLVNQAGMAAFGLTEADIARGVNVFQLLVPEDRERAAADTRRVMGGETRPGTEYTALRKDGSRFPAIIHANRIMRDGQPAGLRGILIDISVRKLTEQTLRENEEKYRLVVDNADEAILVAQDGSIVFANPRTGELLGYAREDLLGRPFIDFLHPDDRARVADNYRRRVAGEDVPVGYEFRIVRRNGETRQVGINAVRVDWQGRPATLNFLADITERKQAEAQIEQLSRFPSENPSPVLRISFDGTLVYANPSSRLLLDVLERGPGMRMPEAWQKRVREAQSSGRQCRFEAVCGSTIYSMLLTPVVDQGYVNAYGRDITERMRAEHALRESEEQFRRAFENSGVGKLLTGLDGRLLRVNRAFAEMLGYTVEELQSTDFMAITHPDDLAASRETAARLQSGTEGSARFEKRYLHKNGSVVWVDLNTVLLRDLNGQPDHFVADVQDITARKLAEAALRESEERYRQLLHQANDGIYVHELNEDRAGRFLQVNDSICRMMGYSREEMLAMEVSDIRMPGSLARMPEVISELRARGSLVFDTENRTKDGRTLPFEVNASLFDLQGRTVVVAIARDISERIRTEAELVEHRDHLEELVHARTRELELANNELEAFSYSVSHDLRAPLRAINGFARALQEDCAAELGTVGRGHLDRVDAASRRMAELIDDLLGLARIARLPLERKPVDLSELARTIAGELREAEPARQVELMIQDGMTAQADPALAAIVLRNLLGNAWKFSGKHPTARIEVGESVRDGEPVWFVRDDGAGFDMAYVDNLFAPFQRLHTTADFPGTGIGLATVQRIVRRHGGRGWIEGKVEKGATYYFTFATVAKET